MNIQHSSRSDRWFTPASIIESVRRVLGTIDLDPASEPLANSSIKAYRTITEDQDGLKTPWRLPDEDPVTVFLNPPGGKRCNKSMTVLFWDKLMENLEKGNIYDAIFVAFSIEALSTTQQCSRSIMDFPFCIPRNRIKFVCPEVKKNAPSHANAIVYVPGTCDMTGLFVKEFRKWGKVKT